MPGCDSFIYNHLDTLCLVYGSPAGTQMQLLKHEVYAENSCFMSQGEVRAACEEVQEIERFSREEGALVLNLLTNTCLGVKTKRKRMFLIFVDCHQAPLWTLEIISTEPRLIKLKEKGTEKCMKFDDSSWWGQGSVITDCVDDYQQEFLLKLETTWIMGWNNAKYCHRPISTPEDKNVFISPQSAKTIYFTETLDTVTFVRRLQVEFPCNWDEIGNGELVWTDSRGMSEAEGSVDSNSPEANVISNPPPFVLPGDQALVRCEEGFGVQNGGEWHREFRVTCTGNFTQEPPICEKKKTDLMIYLIIGLASLIFFLVSIIVGLIYLMK